MAERLTIGNQADPEGRFRADVARLRSVIGQVRDDVLSTARDAAPIAATAWAAWAEGRCLVFGPTNQPAAVEKLAAARQLLVIDGSEGDPQPASALPDPRDDETVLAQFHTSGSTGVPTSFDKRGRQLIGEARFLADVFGIGPEDVLLSGVPACHLYGFLFSVMLPAVSGCALIDATPLYPETIMRLSEECGATVLVSTPSELRALAAAERLPDVARVFSSGSPLPRAVRDRLLERGMTVTEVFGSTETGGIAWRTGGERWQPFDIVEVEARDGLLHVRSPFIDDPESWFAMNDKIELDEDGRFQHLGRSDDIVKVGAKRVSKEALRSALLEVDEVTDVAIGQLVDGGRSGPLHAFLTTGGDVTPDRLRQHLSNTFDPVTIPRIHFVDELPRTALGKISHAALRLLIKQTQPQLDFGAAIVDGDDVRIPLHVPHNCRYFDGHYEGDPILPGVVQLMAIEAQIAEQWPALSAPTRLERIKFHAPVKPDAQLELRLNREDESVSFRLSGQDKLRSSGRLIYG